MPLRSIEADSRDDAIAAAREQYGPTARVVGVRKVRSGGVLGFFATERYVAEVDESEPAPSERRAAQPAPASRPASRPAARPALRQDDDEAIREFSALLGRHDDEPGEPAYRERGYQRPAPRDRSSEGSVPRSSAPRVGTPGGATPRNSGSRKPTGRDPWQQEPAFEEDPFPRAGRSRGAEPARSSARGAASRSLADPFPAFPEASTDAFPDDTDDRVDHRRDDERSDAPPAPSPFIAALARMVREDRTVRRAVDDAVDEPLDRQPRYPSREDRSGESPYGATGIGDVRAARERSSSPAWPGDAAGTAVRAAEPAARPAPAAAPMPEPLPNWAAETGPAPAGQSSREEAIAETLRVALAQGRSDEALADIVRGVLAGASPEEALAAAPPAPAPTAEPVASAAPTPAAMPDPPTSAPMPAAPDPMPAASLPAPMPAAPPAPTPMPTAPAGPMPVVAAPVPEPAAPAVAPMPSVSMPPAAAPAPAPRVPMPPAAAPPAMPAAERTPVESPVTEPIPVQRAATEPVAAQPRAAEPVAAEPVVAEPVAAEPVVAEPVIIDAVLLADDRSAELSALLMAPTASDPAPLPADATAVLPPISLLPPRPSSAVDPELPPLLTRPPVPPPRRVTRRALPAATEPAATALVPALSTDRLATVTRLPVLWATDVWEAEAPVLVTSLRERLPVDRLQIPTNPALPALRAVLPEVVGDLLALGVPEQLLGPGFAEDAAVRGTYAALTRALTARLPLAPEIPNRPGNVLFVVGNGMEALAAARSLSVTVRLDPDRVQWATPGELAGLATEPCRLTSLEAASERCRQAAGAGTMTVVAVDAPLRPGGGSWLARLLAVWAPDAVWAVVEATRKPEDVGPWLTGLPRVDALVVQDTDLSADPAAVLQCAGAPVALLDGVRATPHRWASMLCERLENRWS